MVERRIVVFADRAAHEPALDTKRKVGDCRGSDNIAFELIRVAANWRCVVASTEIEIPVRIKCVVLILQTKPGEQLWISFNIANPRTLRDGCMRRHFECMCVGEHKADKNQNKCAK